MIKLGKVLGLIPALLVLAAATIITHPLNGKSNAPAAYPPEEITLEAVVFPTARPSATRTAAVEPGAARASFTAHPNPAGTRTPAPPATAAPEADQPTAEVTPIELAAEDWKQWPVLPVVTDEMRRVYRAGVESGKTDPHAFSFLGDCQSLPEVFLGVYDIDPDVYYELPPHLQETVAHFSGSFVRYSPTVKDASTAGAMLWAEWNDNLWGKCNPGETPIDCELRVHRPSIVFIHLGTHWEARNQRYLEIIVQKILDAGAVPVVSTKADNRELDERVNQGMAELAVERGLPMWNFRAAVQDMPNGGLVRNSDMYLTDAALEVHRRSAVEALDTLWRELREE